MGSITRRLSLAMLALAALAAPAAAGAGETTFVDAAGRHVAVPAAITHVVPAGPPADVLLFAIAPDRLLGLVEPFSATGRPLVPAAFRDLPKVPRMTADPSPADLASIKALRPDIVIYYGDIGPKYVAFADRVAAATGVPYLLFDGSLVQAPKAVRTVAHLLGRDARGQEVAAAADAVLAELKPLEALAPDRRVAVYYGRGKDGLHAIRPDTSVGEAVALAGGRNVAPAGKGSFVDLTAADVARLAPTVVVVADAAAMAPGSPLRAALPPATRFFADRGAPFRWMEGPPSLNRLVGASWLASKLYPDTVAWRPAQAKALIATLFGIALSDADVTAMLQ